MRWATARIGSLALYAAIGCGSSDRPGAPGMAVTTATTTAPAPDLSRVTLVSMIAPRPGWFVGITAEDFLASGVWPEEIAFDVHAYVSSANISR